MRARFVEVSIAACLLAGLALAVAAGAVPKGIPASQPGNGPAPLGSWFASPPVQPVGSVPLRLPVHVAPWLPMRPAQGGEAFYSVSFLLDYTGGPVTLAGDAAGTRLVVVDDQMTMKVTHPDGTISTYQDKDFAERLPPTDVSQYFRRGVNAVEVTLRDVCGDLMSSTDLWLTSEAPAPARLPLLLHEGVIPQTAWPESLATATVRAPRPGRKVVLAGDRRGKTGTWVTGRLTVRVTRADGSVRDASYDYRSPEGPPQLRPPLDVTPLFGPGANTVLATIKGDGIIASSPLWLTLARE